MTDLATQLGDLAARLAVAAGDLVFEGRKKGITSSSTKSSDTDVVTEFDRASERMIVEGLRAERPDDALVGEEGTDSAGASENAPFPAIAVNNSPEPGTYTAPTNGPSATSAAIDTA